MSQAHLDDLRNALEASHWGITGEGPGNDYDISHLWFIARPDGSWPLTIAFNGVDDMHTLPVEEAYGCHLKEAREVSLYFARIKRSWRRELSTFMQRLEALSAR